jgi:hypothetical protein
MAVVVADDGGSLCTGTLFYFNGTFYKASVTVDEKFPP